jgi:hypothetical protein
MVFAVIGYHVHLLGTRLRSQRATSAFRMKGAAPNTRQERYTTVPVITLIS